MLDNRSIVSRTYQWGRKDESGEGSIDISIFVHASREKEDLIEDKLRAFLNEVQQVFS